eukprot:IDg19769t1
MRKEFQATPNVTAYCIRQLHAPLSSATPTRLPCAQRKPYALALPPPITVPSRRKHSLAGSALSLTFYASSFLDFQSFLGQEL